MGFFSFDQLNELWNFWEVRGIVLCSLFFQSFLILVSPFRTKTANAVVSVLLWLAYLLADAAATFAVGLISHSQGESTPADKTIGDLLAFWAPILIIHLGGPDTITALALEDNELWQRHLLQLVSQLAATLYILYKSLMLNSELLAPTLLVLIVGLIKYGERVYSLYLASVNKFRDSLLTKPDPGLNYARYMEKVNNKMSTGAKSAPPVPSDSDEAGSNKMSIGAAEASPVPYQNKHTDEEPEIDSVLSGATDDKDRVDMEMVQDAYKWFAKFKGLVADLIYSNDDWQETREYFGKRNAKQAFRVVEIELNFLYEALYTKMPVIRTWVGYILRLVCFVLVLESFFLWRSIHKSHIPPIDVKITYALLGGAITLDVIAFFMLIFSDWPIANVIRKGTSGPEDESHQNKKSTCRYQLKQLINTYLAVSDRRWSGYSKEDRTILRKLLSHIFCFWRSDSAAQGDEKTIPFLVMASRIFYRRWSESVQQFNLIDYSVNVRNQKIEKVSGWLGLTDFLDGIQYVSISWFSESLRDSIFSELKAKSETMKKPEDADKICKVRGEWVLDVDLRKILEPWLTKIDYDESLILWHIATEVCYHYDKKQNEPETSDEEKDDESDLPHEENDIENQIKDPTTSDVERDQENDAEQHEQDPKISKSEHNVNRQRSSLETLEKKIHEIVEEEDHDDVQQQKGFETPPSEEEDDVRQQKGHGTVEEDDHIQPQKNHDEIEKEDDDDAEQQKGHVLVEEEDHVQPQTSHDQIEGDDDGEQRTLAKEEAVEQQKDLKTTPADEEKPVADQPQPETMGHEDRVAQQQNNDREISKVVSDYMLYLLIREPKIMTAVAGIGQFRFRDTCAEAKKFFEGLVMDKKRKKRVRNACLKLLEVSTDIPPKEAKGDRSKSLLFEGCRLAKELNKLGDDKWNVIHKVWVEMLCYAATHCSGHTHAAQLSKGGQLITFVWLLMVHLGLGKQFLINEGTKSSR